MKMRLVAMGNIMYNTRMQVRKDLGKDDLWAPVAGCLPVRVVNGRATCHTRRTETIDLVQAYTQIWMGNGIGYYLIIPALIIDILPPELRRLFTSKRCPVCRCKNAVYEIDVAGTKFIRSFMEWLMLNSWLPAVEDPLFLCYWKTEDEGTIMRRALHCQKRVQEAQNGSGRNLMEDTYNELDSRPWPLVVTDLELHEQRFQERKNVAKTS